MAYWLGVITMAWGCYLAVREIWAKRYVYAVLDICGIAIDCWIFPVEHTAGRTNLSCSIDRIFR